MKKILFIEDELTSNISRILNIFNNVLTQKITRQLEAAEANNAFPNEIKEIINQSNNIDVCDSFPEALNKIINNHQNYSLFIIDRNLAENEYTMDQIKEIFSDFNEDTHIHYLNREGDFLFSLLREKVKDYTSMIYFLTANSKNTLQCKDECPEPALSKFMQNNIIDKSNIDDIKKLINIIDENDEIAIRIEHPEIFMLEKIKEIRPQHANTVFLALKTLKESESMSKEQIIPILGSLRLVITGLLNDINKMERFKYFDPVKDNPSERDKINWLEGGKSKKMRAILKPYCDYVYTITSELCLHDNDDNCDDALKKVERTKAYQAGGLPTVHTLNSAICAIKDIFQWIAQQAELNN